MVGHSREKFKAGVGRLGIPGQAQWHDTESQSQQHKCFGEDFEKESRNTQQAIGSWEEVVNDRADEGDNQQLVDLENMTNERM